MPRPGQPANNIFRMDKHAHLPLVTIVIPTYNRKTYIIEAIHSVIKQTYTNWELIVVDDGSTDDTAEAIKSIQDQRIRTIQLPHEGRVGPLRNKGAFAGKGEWICFLDSDDLWMPQKLEQQLKALQDFNSQACYTNFELMSENGITIPVKAGKFKPLSGNIVQQVLTTEASVTVVSLMVSRKVFSTVGGFSADRRLQYRDDYEFVLRLTLHTNIIGLPIILLRIREHLGRRTNALSAAEAHVRSALPYELFMGNGASIELKTIARQQYQLHLRCAAGIHFKKGEYLKAFEMYRKSMRGISHFKNQQKTYALSS